MHRAIKWVVLLTVAVSESPKSPGSNLVETFHFPSATGKLSGVRFPLCTLVPVETFKGEWGQCLGSELPLCWLPAGRDTWELPRYPGTAVTSSQFCFLMYVLFWAVGIKLAVWFRARSGQRIAVALGGKPAKVRYWWLSRGAPLNVLRCTRGGRATAPLRRAARLGCRCENPLPPKK